MSRILLGSGRIPERGSFEIGDVLRIPYKDAVNFWTCYTKKRGLHEATALEISWLQITVYCRDDAIKARGKISLAPCMYRCPIPFHLFILPAQRLYIAKNICIHITDCADNVHELPLLANSTAR